MFSNQNLTYLKFYILVMPDVLLLQYFDVHLQAVQNSTAILFTNVVTLTPSSVRFQGFNDSFFKFKSCIALFPAAFLTS